MQHDFVVDIVGLCLMGRDNDGFLTAQPDATGSDNPADENAPRVASYQLHHTYGFSSLPLDQDENGQCQGLQITIGDVDYVIPLGDPRATSKLPPIKQGESFQYGAAGNFFRCHADGRLSVYTSDKAGSPDGQTVSFVVSPIAFTEQAPWGTLRFAAEGWRMKHQSGAMIDAGAIYGIPGLPGPVDGKLSSYVTLTAARVNVKATAVLLGADTPGILRSPLAKADAAFVVFGAIVAVAQAAEALLLKLAATSAAVGVAPGTTAIVEIAALTSSVGALSSAATSALALMPSVTSST